MPSTKKDFEAARLGVFATSDLPLTHFNCGIRVKFQPRLVETYEKGDRPVAPTKKRESL